MTTEAFMSTGQISLGSPSLGVQPGFWPVVPRPHENWEGDQGCWRTEQENSWSGGRRGSWPRATAGERGKSGALGSPVMIWSNKMNLSRAEQGANGGKSTSSGLLRGMTGSQASLARS